VDAGTDTWHNCSAWAVHIMVTAVLWIRNDSFGSRSRFSDNSFPVPSQNDTLGTVPLSKDKQIFSLSKTVKLVEIQKGTGAGTIFSNFQKSYLISTDMYRYVPVI